MRQSSFFPLLTLTMTFVLACFYGGTVSAQNTDRDKVTADQTLFEQLCANHTPKKSVDFHHLRTDQLTKTNERGLFLVKGAHYQIASLRNDFYVTKSGNGYRSVFSRKYPMESMINLLLNYSHGDTKKMSIVQHLYGGEKRIPDIAIASIHDLLGTTMEAYCSVTSIDKDCIRATLVFHHKKMDFIHLFVVETTPAELFSDTGVLKAELYGNIPQSNIKSLFSKFK